MSREEVAAVLETVRERVDPAPGERAALEATVARLVETTETVIEDLGVEASVRHVGSTARGTWVSGDRDIDLFVLFDPDRERAELAELGLEIGERVLPGGRTEFAEHPYVSGTVRGFDVDLVPCYAVEGPTAIQSAVDRTPFHNRYLERRIDAEQAGEVRLFKQFLKGTGVYGSDLRTEGISGYLSELLVLEHGDFTSTIEAIAGWQPPVRFDPAGHGQTTFEDPLVLIDPTDPERNVAAVVSETNVARLIHHARAFDREPTVGSFFPPAPPDADEETVEQAIRDRETAPLAIVFEPPDLVDDQLYPQLRRSRAGIVRGLENQGFSVLRSAVWARERAVVFLELAVAELPAVERHEGPPVAAREHADRFVETYSDGSATGPFVEGNRYVVERQRAITTARQFLAERIDEVALGAQLESVIEDGHTLLSGPAVAELAEEFGVELARYFDPAP